jgi:hypothetical protein
MLAAGLATALGGFTLVASSAPARAETVDLVCQPARGNIWPFDEHVQVDLSANSVTRWMSGRLGHTPRSYPADITNDQVTFRTGGGEQDEKDPERDFTLNRRTGDLDIYSPKLEMTRSYICRLVAASTGPLF